MHMFMVNMLQNTEWNEYIAFIQITNNVFFGKLMNWNKSVCISHYTPTTFDHYSTLHKEQKPHTKIEYNDGNQKG